MKLIAAVDEHWALGKGGDQLVYISQDLKRFKTLTTGPPVILGRKTMATVPGGRPRKGRRNLMLSRNPDFAPEGAEVYPDLDSLLAQAPEDSCVIGGASVYQALLGKCDTAYITKIHKSYPADCWLPDLDADPHWTLAEESEPLEEDGLIFHYATYKRI